MFTESQLIACVIKATDAVKIDAMLPAGQLFVTQ